ncbi:MAG: ABC transporter permease [Acidobacteriota bacterium]
MIAEVLSAALRALCRRVGVTVLAVALLGLSVTAVGTAFVLVAAVTLAESPYPEADRLWAPRLSIQPPEGGAPSPALFSYPDVATFQQSQDVFDAVGAFVSLELPLTGDPGPERIRGEFVTPDYFVALGGRPVAGSLPARAEPGRSPDFRGEVLLSHRLWRSRFDGDPSVIGQSMEILGVPLRILGVLAPGFESPGEDVDLWLDIGSLPRIADYPDILTGTDYPRLAVVALMRPEVAADAVPHAVERAGRAIAAGRPEVAWGPATVQTLAAARSDPGLRRVLTTLLIAAGCVLLIASFNVAGLQLSSATARSRDFAVRKALGAAPERIVGQVLMESGLLALAGGVVGLAGTWVLVRSVVTTLQTDWSWESTGPDVASLLAAGIDLRVVGLVVAAAVLSTLASGLVPALEVLRRDTVRSLRGGGDQIVGGSGRARALGRHPLVVAQAAAAVASLTVAGLLFHDLGEMLRIDPGFDERSVHALHITSSTLYGPAEAALFHQRLIDEVGRLPGVASTALGSCVPLSCGWTAPVVPAENGGSGASSAPSVGAHFVSPGYFRTLGIPLVAGRDFTTTDTRDTRRVVVVSRSLADRLWPGRTSIGRRVDLGDGGAVAEVVGVAADARQQSLFDVSEDVYLADAQNGAAWGVLFVKSEGDGVFDAGALREVLQRVDPGLPFQSAGSLEDQVSLVSSQSRLSSRLVSIVALLALLLTVLGVYGVASLAVTARTRELALRLAIGADRADLLRRVFAHGLQPVSLGIAFAAPIAWAASRRLDLSVAGTEPAWLAGYLVAAALVAAVAVLASLPPARRALSIEPSVALRKGS